MSMTLEYNLCLYTLISLPAHTNKRESYSGIDRGELNPPTKQNFFLFQSIFFNKIILYKIM